MIDYVNSNLSTLREWIIKENDHWLAEKQTEGDVEAMIVQLNPICNLSLACCEEQSFAGIKTNLSEANFKVVEKF